LGSGQRRRGGAFRGGEFDGGCDAFRRCGGEFRGGGGGCGGGGCGEFSGGGGCGASAAAAAGAGAAADRSPEVEEVLKHRIRQIAYQVELLQNDALRIFLGSKDNARWWAFP